MVKTSAKGSTRSFSLTYADLQQIPSRSNERYDILLNLKFHNQQKMNAFLNRSKKQQKEIQEKYKFVEKGILGECILRSLTFFDVGISFMADSLHNVYSGAFVMKPLTITNDLFLFYL
jgi:hypothetical protein